MNTNTLLSKRTRQLLVLFYLISFSVIVPLLGWYFLHPAESAQQAVTYNNTACAVQR